MSIYKEDSLVPRLVAAITTQQGKIFFLKGRILLFLKGNRGTFYSVDSICTALSMTNFEQRHLVWKAKELLITDKASGVKETMDRTRIIYPKEAQYVY